MMPRRTTVRLAASGAACLLAACGSHPTPATDTALVFVRGAATRADGPSSVLQVAMAAPLAGDTLMAIAATDWPRDAEEEVAATAARAADPYRLGDSIASSPAADTDLASVAD